MHLQHLNSLDRAVSLESACYDMKMAKQISSTVTPNSAAADSSTVKLGFSELLRQTIIGKAKENQTKHRSLMSAPDSNKLLDSELEAALLSLDQSQVTQNMMVEFMNAHQEGPGEATNRKAHSKKLPKDKNANSRLESLIQQLIVRKEIT